MKTKNPKQKALEYLKFDKNTKVIDLIKNINKAINIALSSQKQKYEKELKKWERDYNRNVEWNHKRIQELQKKLDEKDEEIKELKEIIQAINTDGSHSYIQELEQQLSQIRTNTLKEVLKIVDEEIKLCILNEGDDLLLKQLKSQIKKLR